MGLRSEGASSRSASKADAVIPEDVTPRGRHTGARNPKEREAQMTARDDPPKWYQSLRRGEPEGFQQAYLWFWEALSERISGSGEKKRLGKAVHFVRTISGAGDDDSLDIALEAFDKAFEEMCTCILNGYVKRTSAEGLLDFFQMRLKSRCIDGVRRFLSGIVRIEPLGDSIPAKNDAASKIELRESISPLIKRLREGGMEELAGTLEVICHCACHHGHRLPKEISECCIRMLGITPNAFYQRRKRLKKLLTEQLHLHEDGCSEWEWLIENLDEVSEDDEGGDDDDH